MTSFAFSLIFGGGLSYFLIQVALLSLRDAALGGAGLFLVLFLIANCCVWFKASRVQALNETIANVASNFIREIDQIIRAND